MTKLRILGIILAIVAEVKNTPSMAARPSYYEYFCKNNQKIESSFYPLFHEGYTLHINKHISAFTEIRLKFDSALGITVKPGYQDYSIKRQLFFYKKNDEIRIIGLAAVVEVENGPSSAAMPQYIEYFCKGNEDIMSTFFPSLYEGYRLIINKDVSALTEVRLRLDSEAGISFDNDSLRITSEMDPINNVIKFIVLRDLRSAWFKVEGKKFPHHPPYVTSIKINGIEDCLEPNQTYFEQVSHSVNKFFDAPDKTCGRRRNNGKYTELIVSGSKTIYGDWPWHAAIYRLDKSSYRYICGGTIISKFFILTAAHCVTIRGQPVIPDILGVILGKHTLIGNNKAADEKKVFKVILHDEYNYKTQKNDIALLKLRTEAVFNNFVQPACLWFDRIDDHMGIHEFTGSVVGWGFDNTDSLTEELHHAVMPQVPELTCIKLQPVFYSAMLDGTKFCAGHGNGQSACNGDSGGGFLVFVNDVNSSGTDSKDIPGAWYVRGIVSTTLSRQDAAICNPNAYGVFTDVSKYTEWIQNQMSAN